MTRACLTRGINPTRNTRYVFVSHPLSKALLTAQRYHSIHARGERISDVLKAAQDSNKQDIGEDNTPAEKLKGQGLDSEGGGINLTWTKDIPKVSHIPCLRIQ